jgi:hypothetical protein
MKKLIIKQKKNTLRHLCGNKILLLYNIFLQLPVKTTMTRGDFILAVLATFSDANYTPVQLQKIFFLLDKNLDKQVKYSPGFNFIPYHYGPFDKGVYEELDGLEINNLVEVKYNGFNKLKNYHLTIQGQKVGNEALKYIDEKSIAYIKRINEFVKSLSFEQLIKAIYNEYPEMKANSIFFQ